MLLGLNPYVFSMLPLIDSLIFETQFHADLTQRFWSMSTERP